MGRVVFLSFTAALNPTLVAVTTVMLLLDHPKRLMAGYLCGALMTSVTLGLVIVFALQDSSTTNTTQHTLSPAADLALGALALVGAFVLGSGRDERLHEWRERRQSGKEKKPPRWQQALNKGTARMTFLIGALLTLPGASYLLGLRYIDKLGYGTAETVLVVLGFNMVMLVLLEVPLAAFVFAPDWTPGAIERAKAWVGGRWHRYAFIGLLVVGLALLLKGVIGLLS